MGAEVLSRRYGRFWACTGSRSVKSTVAPTMSLIIEDVLTKHGLRRPDRTNQMVRSPVIRWVQEDSTPFIYQIDISRPTVTVRREGDHVTDVTETSVIVGTV